MVDKCFYNVTLSQTISPCGRYLVAGNNYGNISVFDLDKVLSGEEGEEKKALNTFQSPNSEQVCSLASTSKFLVTGTVGEIHGWAWDSILGEKPKVAWSMQTPPTNGMVDKVDVNAMFAVEDGEIPLLYAGCGDNCVYVFSLEDGKRIRAFEGHSDYIHSLSVLGSQLASCSEDGSVRIWDLRQNEIVSIIEPFKNEKAARPYLGRWIGDVGISPEALVCGGGPRLCLWDLRTLETVSTCPEVEDDGIHIAKFHSEMMFAGGRSRHFYQLNLSGQVLSKMDTSSANNYSAVFSSSPHEVFSIGGSSNSLDLCTDLSGKFQVLNFM